MLPRWRQLLPNQGAVLQADTRLFLAEVFDRVVPTSTFAERIFARLNRWTDRKGPKPYLTTLAAKHAVFHFRQLTERWREEEVQAGRVPKARSQLARPVWAHGSRRGRALNGTHTSLRKRRALATPGCHASGGCCLLKSGSGMRAWQGSATRKPTSCKHARRKDTKRPRSAEAGSGT